MESVPIARNAVRFVIVALLLLATSRADAQDVKTEIAARRAALARAIGEGTLVVVSAPESEISRNGYVPDQNYLYLTGLREPGGALLMRIHGGVAESQIFVADKDPAAEVWTGVRMGVVGPRRIRAVTHLDVDADGIQRAVQAVRSAL